MQRKLRTTLAAMIVLVGFSGLATAYHVDVVNNPGAADPVDNFDPQVTPSEPYTWNVGNNLLVLCESLGPNDPVNDQPVVKEGDGGLCFMSAGYDSSGAPTGNESNGLLPDGTLWQEDVNEPGAGNAPSEGKWFAVKMGETNSKQAVPFFAHVAGDGCQVAAGQWFAYHAQNAHFTNDGHVAGFPGNWTDPVVEGNEQDLSVDLGPGSYELAEYPDGDGPTSSEKQACSTSGNVALVDGSDLVNTGSANKS